MQEFIIKYLPDILPTIDFESSIVLDAEIQQIAPIIQIAKTSDKWATISDYIKDNRKIQAISEKRYKIEWVLQENVTIENLELADNVKAITVDARS